MIGAEASENGYIQGAGDDSEGWSHGLTPALYWKHQQQLLVAVEEDVLEMIQRLIIACKCSNAEYDNAVNIRPTNLYVGTITSAMQPELYDGMVICSDQPPPTSDQGKKHRKRTKTVHLLCGDGKLGSRALRYQLSRVLSFFNNIPSKGKPPKLLFACSTGKDLSVGVALTVLCMFFDDDCTSHPHLLLCCPYSQLQLCTLLPTDRSPHRSFHPADFKH